MPIYEYTCDHCEERFERLVRTGCVLETSPRCPNCGRDDTRRAVSSFALAGGPRVDPEEAAARDADADRRASITPKEQIDRWRASRKERQP